MFDYRVLPRPNWGVRHVMQTALTYLSEICKILNSEAHLAWRRIWIKHCGPVVGGAERTVLLTV